MYWGKSGVPLIREKNGHEETSGGMSTADKRTQKNFMVFHIQVQNNSLWDQGRISSIDRIDRGRISSFSDFLVIGFVVASSSCLRVFVNGIFSGAQNENGPKWQSHIFYFVGFKFYFGGCFSKFLQHDGDSNSIMVFIICCHYWKQCDISSNWWYIG